MEKYSLSLTTYYYFFFPNTAIFCYILKLCVCILFAKTSINTNNNIFFFLCSGWRSSGGKVQIVREFESKSTANSSTTSTNSSSTKRSMSDSGNNTEEKSEMKNDSNNKKDSTMWCNPFAPPMTDDIDDEEARNSQKNSPNRENSNENSNSLHSEMKDSKYVVENNGNRDKGKQMSILKNNSGIVGGYSLSQGGLDEKAEHEVEFKKLNQHFCFFLFISIFSFPIFFVYSVYFFPFLRRNL